ncbi:hypothetical protein BaRGS_00015233 [Batillaria attramentaria]|uniref:Uncharacterized protein n=1 Tax=Batillaria attramentaria TaxID=370345 RepID=A0ABD0L2B2_9CAEN
MDRLLKGVGGLLNVKFLTTGPQPRYLRSPSTAITHGTPPPLPPPFSPSPVLSSSLHLLFHYRRPYLVPDGPSWNVHPGETSGQRVTMALTYGD